MQRIYLPVLPVKTDMLGQPHDGHVSASENIKVLRDRRGPSLNKPSFSAIKARSREVKFPCSYDVTENILEPP